MFYVTKPVLKHPPRAVVFFCPYINSSYLLDKILAIKRGLFSKVIVPFFVRGGVFVLEILSLVAILSNLPQNEHEQSLFEVTRTIGQYLFSNCLQQFPSGLPIKVLVFRYICCLDEFYCRLLTFPHESRTHSVKGSNIFHCEYY